MTPAQEEHLKTLQDTAREMIGAKYTKGVQEHGGNLWEMSPLALVEEALMECIDQLAYLLTLRQRLFLGLQTMPQYCLGDHPGQDHTLDCYHWTQKNIGKETTVSATEK